jgi:hypothetical protein
MCFDPYNRFLKIRKSIKTPTPKLGAHLGVKVFILTPSHTLGLPSWPESLQALALVTSARLGLRHVRQHEVHFVHIYSTHSHFITMACPLRYHVLHLGLPCHSFLVAYFKLAKIAPFSNATNECIKFISCGQFGYV